MARCDVKPRGNVSSEESYFLYKGKVRFWEVTRLVREGDGSGGFYKVVLGKNLGYNCDFL